MRKITAEAVEAFLCGDYMNKGNTRVEDNIMYLHDNAIAKRGPEGLFISCGGWTSTTTKERLNGLLSELDLGGIYQKDYVWYFDDGSEFNTDGWNKIK